MKLSLTKIMESITEDNKKGQMVAFYVPSSISKKLLDLFEDVPGEPLSPQDMHITLGLVHDGDPSLVGRLLKAVAPDLKAPKIEIDGFGFFPPNEHNHQKYILYAKPKAESLKDVHDKIFDLFKKFGVKIDNGAFDFNPHITVKYCDKEPDVASKEFHASFIPPNVTFANNSNLSHVRIK